MATVSFGAFAKRRNSTKQPTTELSDVRTVTLKETTSQDRPTFIVTGNDFDYNYCSWNNKYYFIEDIESLRNNEIAVHCLLDPLATYKTEIEASTQFVCYAASAADNAYLVDNRIPVLKDAHASASTSSMSSLFSTNGFYVLTAVGKDGCTTYAMDLSSLEALLDKINDWSDDIIDDVFSGNYPWSHSSQANYDFTTVEDSFESLAKMTTLSGVVGNAYQSAPQCIRSCIWVPFFPTNFLGGSAPVFLGQFDCDMTKFVVKAEPVTGSVSVSIPWQNSGWRRAYCEDVYLYLPLVGMVSLSSDNLVGVSSLTVHYSATATDGCVCYQVKAGSQIIGSYGGQCSANFPIGISQQASAGQIAQTAFAGLDKTVSTAVNSSISPVSAAAAGVGVVLSGIEASYNLADTALSRNNSCIGGVGGGAGAGLDLNVTCYTVSHSTVIQPGTVFETAYHDTMGKPVMLPLQLSGLSGYCQCANAHIEAAATAQELNAIDAMINTGFYLE